MTAPETQYALAGDSHIAYQVTGSGPLDVLMLVGSTICIDLMYDLPSFARFIDRFGSFCRLIRFDRRGVGASDPLSDTSQPTLEQWTDDALAVLDAIGSRRAAVMSTDPAGMVAFLLAASHPHRVSHLVLTDPAVTPRSHFADLDDRLALILAGYREGRFPFTSYTEEVMTTDSEFATWLKRARRLGASPSSARSLYRVFFESDVGHLLSSIHVPTLVINRPNVPFELREAESVARQIRDARIVEYAMSDPYIWATDDSDALVDDVQEFLTGTRPAPPSDDRVFAAMLFTDIVDSTKRTAAIGDKRWRELLDAHDHAVRQEVTRFKGKVVKSTGDGVLATFDGPARAVRCSQAIATVVGDLELGMRAGVHAGEVELRGNDLAGISVMTARRVCDAGGPGDLLVSRTVTDLVAGSGLEFDDRGEHELKGVPGRWQLYAVRS